MTDAETLSIFKNVFGFDSLRPGQERIIEAILRGRLVLAVMPTGAGKSLCYQLPALTREGLTLVVSPLVTLMTDQVEALRLSGVTAETINSNRSRSEYIDSWRRVSSGEARHLYMAPERLLQPRMLEALQGLPIGLIAIDEAHCISRWGPAFRPDYEALAQLAASFPKATIAALTATADRVPAKISSQSCLTGPQKYLSQALIVQISIYRFRNANPQTNNFCGLYKITAAKARLYIVCPEKAPKELLPFSKKMVFPHCLTMLALKPRFDMTMSRLS